MGRDERVWENAQEFDPGRFLAGGKHAGVDYQGAHAELLPFGAGRRMCPGIAIATVLLQFTVASLLTGLRTAASWMSRRLWGLVSTGPRRCAPL